jgi:DNA-binding NtrC family response regulator
MRPKVKNWMQAECLSLYKGALMNDPQHLRPALAGQPVVLVAEDEVMICNNVCIALERAGMFVLAANDGKQALELSRKFPDTIHVLVSDIVMPHLGGLSLCEQIQRERPAIKVLLMSGNNGPFNGVPFLRKPFKLEELKQQVWKLLRGEKERAVGALQQHRIEHGC